MSKYLMARIIEGTDKWFNHIVSDGKYHEFIQKDNASVCVTAPCTQEGFNSLYSIGKQLWNSNMCSKFEIAAFDTNRLFWKHRPDMYNFERNYYKGRFEKVIDEEFKSFSSSDFQNDPLEIKYVTDYQKQFWFGKTNIYEVDAFKSLVADTKLYEDFNTVRQWVDKMEAEVPLEKLSDMSFIPRECGFEHNGQWIVNPFYDETLRFSVEPFRYYGEENITGYIERVKLVIADASRQSLAEQIVSAKEKFSDSIQKNFSDRIEVEKDIERN